MADGNGNGLAQDDARFRFSQEQRQLIRDTVGSECNEIEFAALMALCELRGMNPLLGDCHFVKQWDKSKGRAVWSIRASIDWMRAQAEDSGLYAGQDEPEYEYDNKKRLLSARVRIWRKDWTRPVVGVAFFEEYVQKTKEGQVTQFWATKPRLMLAKCAEAIGLRKAFPRRFAEVYATEEGLVEETPVRTPAQVNGTVPRSIPEQAISSKIGLDLLFQLRKAETDDQCVAVGKAKMSAYRAGTLTGEEARALDSEIRAKREDLKSPPPPPDSGPTPPDEEDDRG